MSALSETDTRNLRAAFQAAVRRDSKATFPLDASWSTMPGMSSSNRGISVWSR